MAFKFIKSMVSGGNGAGGDLLLPVEEFKTLILHECARCDRNAHAFSLIHIDLRLKGNEKMQHGGRALRQLCRSLVKRMRATDEVGWLDDHSLGVFLPETGTKGAQSLAMDTCSGFTYQIYTYPYIDDVSRDLDLGGPRDRNREERKGRTRDRTGPEDRTILHQQFEETLDGTNDSAGSNILLNKDLRPSPGTPSSTGVDNGSANSVVELVMPPGAPAWKRVYDIFGSAFLLVVLSPLFAAVALYIKIVSPGPVFFRQERVGYLGRPFTILKFRTMRADADHNVHKSHLKNLISGDKVLTKLDQETDTRWIPLAGILRKTCIDELPQLVNVLKGEMSLIGPRPVLFYEAEEYSLWQHQRFHSLPGMTGLWQVSGKNRLTFSQMMRLDARYSRKYNFLMDQLIFIKTVPAILGQVLESVQNRYASHPLKKNITVWRRSVNDFVRQVFL